MAESSERSVRIPFVGAVVRYCLVRKLPTFVEAVVIATCESDPSLRGQQVRLSIQGKKNPHPTGPIEYGDGMCMWSWPSSGQAG